MKASELIQFIVLRDNLEQFPHLLFHQSLENRDSCINDSLQHYVEHDSL